MSSDPGARPSCRPAAAPRAPSLLPLLLLVPMALVPLLGAPARAAGQDPCVICEDDQPPEVTIVPSGGTFTTASLGITVEWCDDYNLDGNTRELKLNGVVVTSSFSYETSSNANCTGQAKMKSVGTVTLAAGSNTFTAKICDLAGQCTTRSASYTYSADTTAPTVAITPNGGTFSSPDLSVTIDWCDDVGLDGASRVIKLRGTTVTSNFSYVTGSANCTGAAKAQSTGTVTLVSGSNSFYAKICDTSANCGEKTVTYTLSNQAAPVVSLAPHNGEYANAAAQALDNWEAVVAYTTPAYVSLDVPRAVTLVYRSGQAKPMGYVQFDVSIPSGTDTPDKFSARLKTASGTFVTFTNGTTEIFWQGSSTTRRLGLLFDASALSTGGYGHTLIVRSWFGSTIKETTTPVRVLVVNEKDSPFGWGWSVAGLQQLHFQGDSVAIAEGDGSLAFFAKSGTSWQSPKGDFSVLTQRGDGTYRRRYPNGDTLSYSAAGLLVSASDRYGNVTTYTYDGSSRLWKVTDPAGKVITFAYTTGGYTIDDPGATPRRTTVTVDAAKNVTRIRDPGGLDALVATYDGSHRLKKRTDRRGGAWGFAYDAHGKLAADTMPTVLADGANTRPVVLFKSLEAVVLPASGTGSSTTPATAVAPSAARPEVTNPRGKKTTFLLDRWGSPTEVAEPLARVTKYVRDDSARVVRTTSPAGLNVDYTWSGPRLTKVVNASTARTINLAYELTFNQPTQVSGDVALRRFFYQATNGRLDSMYVGTTSQMTRFTYDARGRVTKVRDPEGHVTFATYQGTGWQNLATVKDSTRPATVYGYGDYGRLVQVTDPQGNTGSVAYDALNRVTVTTGALADSTRYTYDALYLTQVKDAVGQTWGYTPNALGWVTQQTDPRGFSDAYGYDRNGNVTGWTNRLGQQVTFTYDDLDLLLSRTAGGQTTSYKTDPLGRWAMAVNGASRDTVKFDLSGRPTEVVTRRGTTTYKLKSTWDRRDRRTRLETTSPWTGKVVRYGYNATTARLDTLTDLAGGVSLVAYNTDGQVKWVRYPTGDTLHSRFPSTHRLGELKWSRTALDGAFGTKYGQDSLSRVVGRFFAGSDTSRHFTYDGGGRLTKHEDRALSEATCTWSPEQGFDCSGGTVQTVATKTYGWDKVGNPAGTGVTVGTGNRLLGYGGYTLTWDDAGRLVSKTGNGVTQTLWWSPVGELDSVSTDGVKARFQYDGFGRRVKKTVGSTVTQTLWDGADPFIELDGAGEVTAEYTYWPGVDRPHSVRRGGGTYYYAADDLGTILGLFNSTGSVMNRYRYQPFGAQESELENVPNSLRFTARQWDSEAGLYYYRARYYDPAVLRFLSEDPIGLAGGINPYAYAGNDPVNATDPFGLITCYRFRIPFNFLVELFFCVGDSFRVEAPEGGGGRRQIQGPGFPPRGVPLQDAGDSPFPVDGGGVITRAPQLPSGFYIDPDALNRCGTAVSQLVASAGFDIAGLASGGVGFLGRIAGNSARSAFNAAKAGLRFAGGRKFAPSAASAVTAAGMTGRDAAKATGSFVASGLPGDAVTEGTSLVVLGEFDLRNFIPGRATFDAIRVGVPEACGG